MGGIPGCRSLLLAFCDPVYCKFTVMRIDLDSDRPAVAPRGGKKRAPAPHERVEHGITNKGEKFHAAQRKFDGKRGRVADPGLALAIKSPQAIGPVLEFIRPDIGLP